MDDKETLLQRTAQAEAAFNAAAAAADAARAKLELLDAIKYEASQLLGDLLGRLLTGSYAERVSGGLRSGNAPEAKDAATPQPNSPQEAETLAAAEALAGETVQGWARHFIEGNQVSNGDAQDDKI